jgi:hypothetical protein
MRRYSLFDPTHVWIVMLGRACAAHAQDAEVVGRVVFHQITTYVRTRPLPSA